MAGNKKAPPFGGVGWKRRDRTERAELLSPPKKYPAQSIFRPELSGCRRRAAALQSGEKVEAAPTAAGALAHGAA